VEIGFDNIGWPILDLELDDSRDKKFSQTEDQTIIKNQKSKFKKTEEQMLSYVRDNGIRFEKYLILFSYLQASACF